MFRVSGDNVEEIALDPLDTGFVDPNEYARPIGATRVTEPPIDRAVEEEVYPLDTGLFPALQREERRADAGPPNGYREEESPAADVVDPGRSIALFAAILAGKTGRPIETVLNPRTGTLTDEYIGLAISVYGDIAQRAMVDGLTMEMLMYEIPGEMNLVRTAFADAIALYKQFKAPGSAYLTATYVRGGGQSETGRYNFSSNFRKEMVLGDSYWGKVNWFRNVVAVDNPLLEKHRIIQAKARMRLRALGRADIVRGVRPAAAAVTRAQRRRRRVLDEPGPAAAAPGFMSQDGGESVAVEDEDQESTDVFQVKAPMMLSEQSESRVERLNEIIERAQIAIDAIKIRMPRVLRPGFVYRGGGEAGYWG